MLKKFFKSSIYLIALTIVSIVGAVLINSALAVWTGPTASPPANNIANLLFSGNDASLKLLTLTGSNLYLNQTTNNKFYADSKKGVQIRLDSDNNDANAEFTVNNGLNAEVFKIDETGLVTVINKITGLLTPTAATDAATKAYVDAAVGAAGGGDATIANQELIKGTGFNSAVDSLKVISGKIPTLVGTATYDKQVEIANKISLANGWVLPNQTYYSVGGNTYFCRQNQVNGTGAVIVTSINNNQQCDIENGITWRCTGGACVKGLTYTGATYSETDCVSAGGSIVSDSNNKTFCKFSGTNVSCPSGWAQADNWQRYSSTGFGTHQIGDWCCTSGNGWGCYYTLDSAPITFANSSTRDCEPTGAAFSTTGVRCSGGWGSEKWWYLPDYDGYSGQTLSCTYNFSTNRVEIGCK